MKAQRTLLNQIDQLEFKQGHRTTGRRLSPIQQLTCVGPLCKKNAIDNVVCDNVNQSGSEPEWHCTAKLPEHLKLGQTRISCEGYDDSSDPFVLIGSCGLKYELKLKFAPNSKDKVVSDSSTIHPIFIVFFVAFILLILFNIIKNSEWYNRTQSQDAPPDYDTATSSASEDYQQTTQTNRDQSAFSRMFQSHTSYPRQTIIVNNPTTHHCNSRPQPCRSSSTTYSQTESNRRTYSTYNSTESQSKPSLTSRLSNLRNGPSRAAHFSPSTEIRSTSNSSSSNQSSYWGDDSSYTASFSPSTETR